MTGGTFSTSSHVAHQVTSTFSALKTLTWRTLTRRTRPRPRGTLTRKRCALPCHKWIVKYCSHLDHAELSGCMSCHLTIDCLLIACLCRSNHLQLPVCVYCHFMRLQFYSDLIFYHTQLSGLVRSSILSSLLKIYTSFTSTLVCDTISPRYFQC